jgi:hypothetical protein
MKKLFEKMSRNYISNNTNKRNFISNIINKLCDYIRNAKK